MHWQRSLLTAEKPTRAVLEVFLQEKEKAGVKGSRFLENEVGGVRPDSRAHGSVSAGEPAILPQHAPEPEWNTPVPSFVLTEAPHARTAVSEALLPATAMPMEKTESSLEAAISPAAGAKGCMAPCPWGVNGTSILVARHPIQKSKSSSPLGCERARGLGWQPERRAAGGTGSSSPLSPPSRPRRPRHRAGPPYGAASWLPRGEDELSDGNFQGEDSAAAGNQSSPN